MNNLSDLVKESFEGKTLEKVRFRDSYGRYQERGVKDEYHSKIVKVSVGKHNHEPVLFFHLANGHLLHVYKDEDIFLR